MQIRKVYLSYLLRAVLKRGPGFLFSAASRYIRLYLGYRVHRPLAGPLSGTLSLTYACNLKCVMCDLPARHRLYEKDSARRKMSTEDFQKVICDFARIGTSSIAFTGGEPLLHKGVFDMLREARKRKMISQLTSNGWYVRQHIDAIFDSGLDSLSISLDGATAETHDSIRGQIGSFARATESLRLLVDERRKRGSSLKVSISSTFSEKNYFEAQALVRLAGEIGVDHIGFMPVNYIAPTIAGTRPTLENNVLENIRSTLRWLMDERKRNSRLETSERYLSMFEACLVGGKMPVACLASYTTFMVDAYGDYFPCHSFYQMEKPWGNYFREGLQQYWKSHAANEERRKIRGCRDCFWNCQVETNLLYV